MRPRLKPCSPKKGETGPGRTLCWQSTEPMNSQVCGCVPFLISTLEDGDRRIPGAPLGNQPSQHDAFQANQRLQLKGQEYGEQYLRNNTYDCPLTTHIHVHTSISHKSITYIHTEMELTRLGDGQAGGNREPNSSLFDFEVESYLPLQRSFLHC